MPSFIRLVTVVVFVISIASPSALAQTPEQDRIKQLEQENDELRQTLAQLRLELSQLKRELKKHADADDEKGADKQSPATEDADGEQPGEEDEKEKSGTFRSADEMFREIPDYLRPAKDGWDKAQTQTTGNWLKVPCRKAQRWRSP